MSTLLFWLGVVRLTAAINVRLPLRRPLILNLPFFFAGWLVGELALHWVALGIASTVALGMLGALDAPPGIWGLGLSVVAWILLVGSHRDSASAGETVERALHDGLGPNYSRDLPGDTPEVESPPLRLLARPFSSIHRPDVEREKDLVYHQEGRLRLRLDLYRPKRQDGEPRPVLLQIHGGAWIIGSKEEQGLPLLNHVASKGWIGVAINYRLSPRAQFPDHLIDVKRAIAWIREHIADYGGDPGYIVISGGSAGGHLASLAALTPGEPEYQPGFEGVDTGLRGCVPCYGVYDFVDEERTYRTWVMQQHLERLVMKVRMRDQPEAFRAASPIHRIGRDIPPFLIVHGTHDTLVPVAQARLFRDALIRAEAATVCYAEIPGAQHAFDVFPSRRSMLTVYGIGRFLGVIRERHSQGREAITSSATAPS